MTSAARNGVILGIWDGHDAGAALIVNRVLRVAVSEERLCREKRASGFPYRAVAACLRDVGCVASDVQIVALAGRSGRLPMRALDPLYRRQSPSRDPLSVASTAVRTLETRLGSVPLLGALETRGSEAVLLTRLRGLGFSKAQVVLVDHHTAHAWTARLVAGDDATLVTMDGYGDGLAATFGALGRTPTRLPSPAWSFALVYGAVTRLLGFGEGDEGKVMGLAARGDPTRFGPAFEALMCPGRIDPRLGGRAARRTLEGATREDVAAGLQAALETRCTALVGEYVPQGQTLGLAGGLFANVSLNGRLRDIVGPVTVFPHMGDGGLCVGAAIAVSGPVLMGLPLLGPSYDDAEIAGAIAASGLRAARSCDPEGELASAIAGGELVARWFGRSEFGPRALGHRSIFARADDPARLVRLNEQLRRDDFMPFAPIRRFGAGSPTMTTTVPADAELRSMCPAVVHVDGTVRTQLADKRADPRLWSLLERTEARGMPALVNTSFNVHGEPIVESPEDAIRTFCSARLDVMQLGEWIVRRHRPAVTCPGSDLPGQ